MGERKGPETRDNKTNKNQEKPFGNYSSPTRVVWALSPLATLSPSPPLLVPRLSVTIRELWKALRASPTRWMKSSTTRSKCTEPGDTWGQKMCEAVEVQGEDGSGKEKLGAGPHLLSVVPLVLVLLIYHEAHNLEKALGKEKGLREF